MGGDGGGPAGLSCWGRAPTHLGETVEMDRCVSPCWHFFPSALLGSFFHVCWVGGGREMVLPLPQHLPLPRKSPFPPLPNRRQRKGREVGGQGSPSVLRLHRVFRLNQEIFYYQKEKRKKKIPAATFPPYCILCPSFPRAGHFLPQAAVGTFVPLLKTLCHLLPPLLGRRRG